MSSVADIITEVARSLGVPADLAIATAQVESGLDPNAVGDSGTSFGLFQLHQGGELGSLTPQQAFDPRTNAQVALSEFAQVQQQHPGADPGWIAAWSQRPADPSGYASKVDAALAQVDAGGISGALSPGPGLPNYNPRQPNGPGIGNPLDPLSGIAGAIAGVPASIGHGLANAAGASIEDVKIWAKRNAVALAVALAVSYVLFADAARGAQQPA